MVDKKFTPSLDSIPEDTELKPKSDVPDRKRGPRGMLAQQRTNNNTLGNKEAEQDKVEQQGNKEQENPNRSESKFRR